MTKDGKEVKILCVFSRLLGGKVFTNDVVELIKDNKNIIPTYLFIDNEDYRRYSAPMAIRFSSALETLWVLKKKYSGIAKNIDFDMLFIQGFELTVGLFNIIKKTPTLVFLDSTPILSHRLIANSTSSHLAKMRSNMASFISLGIFRKVFSQVDMFIPRTSWCADSLIEDFGINPEKIRVTAGFKDLLLWCPIEKNKKEKLSLLLVGNNFKQKGGEFILEIYEKYLSGRFLLRIVSNDKFIPDLSHVEGVEVIKKLSHKNISKLVNIYQTSDIFIFPTRLDKLGLVLTEATAVGLPIIASNTGGVKEFVKDGFNGFLMPYNSKPEDWAKKIMALSENEELLKEFSRNSRKLAEEKLQKKDFMETIEKAIKELSVSKSKTKLPDRKDE